jgi:hypothetical protein
MDMERGTSDKMDLEVNIFPSLECIGLEDFHYQILRLACVHMPQPLHHSCSLSSL